MTGEKTISILSNAGNEDLSVSDDDGRARSQGEENCFVIQGTLLKP